MIAGIITLTSLLAFLGGAAWAYSSRRKPEFDAASRIPLDDHFEDAP